MFKPLFIKFFERQIPSRPLVVSHVGGKRGYQRASKAHAMTLIMSRAYERMVSSREYRSNRVRGCEFNHIIV